ncbi:MAG: MgtC/SapB family protein [bacterium]|nr:MgtC/SapB family protein [bacterium]
MQDILFVEIFFKFALATLIGFLIGLEREMRTRHQHTGLRDFILVSLLGAISAFAADTFGNAWLIVAAFAGFAGLMLSGYWLNVRAHGEDLGQTTEVAAILTFFLGVLVFKGAPSLAVATAIVIVGVLSYKRRLHDFRKGVQAFEFTAVLKLLVITFIILPILPREPLSHFLTFPMGTVNEVTVETREVVVELTPGRRFESQQVIDIYETGGRPIGTLTVRRANAFNVWATYEGENIDRLQVDEVVRSGLGIQFLSVMAEAIRPYRAWLIVVLVSFISFIGYVLSKTIGGRASTALTGVIGGLASSTVTTVIFARRSKEAPRWNRHFSVAVVLASAVMFPRLLVQISVVNLDLMKIAAAPMMIMAGVGVLVAFVALRRSSDEQARSESLKLENPFSMKAALSFALIFAVTLMATRLAIDYLGDGWLPLVSLLSGLSGADAIAFSVSDAQQAGLITLDWAGFNFVLGAIANTIMKLFIVLAVGNRGLFKALLIPFLTIVTTGVAAMFFFFDVL